MRWTADQNITMLNDLNTERLGAYLDQVRKIATKADYGKVFAILKRLLDFCVQEACLDAPPLGIERPKPIEGAIKVFTRTGVR